MNPVSHSVTCLVAAALPLGPMAVPYGLAAPLPAVAANADAGVEQDRPGGHARPSRPAGRPGGHARPNNRPPVRGGSHTNINHNNVNVNVNHGGHRPPPPGHHSHYDHHHDWDDDWDDHWHPLRTATTVALTAAVVGSIVRSLPPDCSTVIVGGISYSQCGSTWYEPRYSGSSVQYVVVNPPR